MGIGFLGKLIEISDYKLSINKRIYRSMTKCFTSTKTNQSRSKGVVLVENIFAIPKGIWY